MQRGLWPCREPHNADYLTALCLPAPPTVPVYCHRRQLLCLWSGGRDLVEQPGPCVQQRPVPTPVPWRDFRCAATAADPDHGRRCPTPAPAGPDLLEVLDGWSPTIRLDTRGDLWRMPALGQDPQGLRGASGFYLGWLPRPTPLKASASACRMFINKDELAGTSETRYRQPDRSAHPYRPTVICPLGRGPQGAEAAAPGSHKVDFLVSNCEGDRPARHRIQSRHREPGFLNDELWELSGWAFDDFPARQRRSSSINCGRCRWAGFPRSGHHLPNREERSGGRHGRVRQYGQARPETL